MGITLDENRSRMPARMLARGSLGSLESIEFVGFVEFIAFVGFRSVRVDVARTTISATL
jgi:hypothetical protein